MANCNTQIELHQLPGKTQQSRILSALKTDFVLLDERKIEDLIVSTIQLSEHVHFYGPENSIDGNWSSFFSWEPTSLFAELSTLNINNLQNELRIKTRKLLFIEEEFEKKEEMLGFFQGITDKIEYYNEKLVKLPRDIHDGEYYLSFWTRLKNFSEHVINQIELTSDTHQLFNDHLFNKAVRNLFGMLLELKTKSSNSFKIQIESYPKHSPQYTLFLTFLKLFSEAQKEANKFTKRHLNFYYKKVLKLKPSSSKPDFVHCLVVPHKNRDSFLIEQGSLLLAGKTEDEKSKYYSATSDIAVNQAKIDQVFGGFLDKTSSPDKYYFKDFSDVHQSREIWKPFSRHSVSQNTGFALASPLLFLKGGDRDIRISFENNWNGSMYRGLINHFNFYVSAEEEWLKIENENLLANNDEVVISILADKPSIVPFNAEIHEGVSIKTSYPVLKFVSKDGHLFKERIDFSSIEVTVDNYSNFSLFSDSGEIDFSKKFEAFGPIPRKGASMYFSSNEFFQKKGAKGRFEVEMDKGDWKFFDHTSLSILSNGIWTNPGSEGSNEITSEKTIKPKDPDFKQNPIYDKSSVNAIARIQFDDYDFSASVDKQSYLDAYLEASKPESTSALPYLPTVTNFKFSYDASSIDNEIETFHLYEKGYHQTDLNESFVPKITNEAELFVGISDHKAGQPLSLLVQLEEGTANPTYEAASVEWEYLNHNNQWVSITGENFGDETNGLTQSGIVYFKIPYSYESSAQTILPKSLFWLKISVPERTAAVCNFVSLHLQAFKAVLTDYENSGVEFTKHLEPETIIKLLKPLNSIKKIEQPYKSFGGRPEDTDIEFYKHTSERLRHRSRAISKWDYETLVLDKFPHVYRVKCLTHFKVNNDKINNSSAGNVTIVPVASSNNTNLPVSWRPLVDLGTMKRIKEYLQLQASPHVTIDVIPPNLEQVIFSFNIKYHESETADSRLYSKDINELINAYLSPWAYETKDNVQFQNEIQTSKLIQIIESQAYVSHVWDFKVKHFDDSLSVAEKQNKTFRSSDTIVPLTEYTLFLPGTHDVKSENNCCK